MIKNCASESFQNIHNFILFHWKNAMKKYYQLNVAGFCSSGELLQFLMHANRDIMLQSKHMILEFDLECAQFFAENIIEHSIEFARVDRNHFPTTKFSTLISIVRISNN